MRLYLRANYNDLGENGSIASCASLSGQVRQALVRVLARQVTGDR